MNVLSHVEEVYCDCWTVEIAYLLGSDHRVVLVSNTVLSAILAFLAFISYLETAIYSILLIFCFVGEIFINDLVEAM